MEEDFDIPMENSPEKSDLANEIANFESRATKKNASPDVSNPDENPKSDEDEDIGLTAASREKFKEKILVEQLFAKYLFDRHF